MSNNNSGLTFSVRTEGTDIGIQLRLQQISNGWMVRHTGSPVFFSTLKQAAEAISEGILSANWPTAPAAKKAVAEHG